MSARERQIAEALATRERQVERHADIERLLEQQPTHHGWGVSVKDHQLWRDDDDDRAAERAYNRAKDEFWKAAERLAREHGFIDVYAAGRSGGWCVIHPQPDVENMWEATMYEWTWTKFAPWALAIRELLRDVRAAYERGEFNDLWRAEATEYGDGTYIAPPIPSGGNT